MWSRNLANPFAMDVESAPRTQPTVATNLDASHRVCPPLKLKPCHPRTSPRLGHLIAPPHWARAARAGSLAGRAFLPQPDGTLRCRQGARLYAQERRPEHDGTVRVLSAARIADCRSCPFRIHCQGHGISTKKPRRVSAVLHPLPKRAPEEPPPACLSAPHPILWGDWSRSQPRRAWIRWQRSHLVTVQAPSVSPPVSTPSALSRGSASALAHDVATTARTQCATTQHPACRAYHLWTLTRVCPDARFASRLS